MADKTVTVKASAGDYTSLNAALSGESANLVTGTCILTIDCYNFEDTTMASAGSGYTTSASYYIKIVAHDSHGGKWSTGAYRLKVTSGGDWTRALSIPAAYTRITGLQIEINTAHSYGTCLEYQVDYCLGDKIIAKAVITGGTNTVINGISNCYAHAVLTNCLAYDFKNGTGAGFGINIGLGWATYSAIVYNCTVINCYYGIFEPGRATFTKNCIAQDCTDGFYNHYYESDTYVDYNLSDIASDAPGTHSRNSKTLTFLDKAGKDFHLASTDTDAINYGVDLSATFTTDIDGTTRPTGAGTWDIGADEYVASETGRTTKNTRAWPLGTGAGMALRMNQ